MLNLEQYDPLVQQQGLNTDKNSKIGTVLASSGNTTLSQTQMGQTLLFDSATGITYTLPTPTVGAEYTFVVTTKPTSGNHKVITDAATTFLLGAVTSGSASGAAVIFQGDGVADVAVTLDGSAAGGFIGTQMKFKCVSSTLWAVTGQNICYGPPNDPFATS